MKPVGEEEVDECPCCGMYMQSIPGSLVGKHISGCCGGNEDWQKIEEVLVSEQRIRSYEAKIRAEKLRAQVELEDIERRERHDKIREDTMARQAKKDRKKRLRNETKEEWKNR